LVGVFGVEGPCKAEISNLHVAFRVKKKVARFKISMKKVCGVHVLKALQTLIYDVLLVDVF
jgi:hypothetical protein